MWNDRNSDSRLVTLVLGGDRHAFRGLVEKYAGIVHGVAYAHLGSHTDAADVCQDTFLRAFESLGSLRITKNLGPWLIEIARNRSRDILRKQQRETVFLQNSAAPESVVVQGQERAEVQHVVRQQLATIEPDAREVLVLHYFMGRNTREIAALLGITKSAAAKRLQRARDVLGKRLVDVLGEELQREEKPKQNSDRIMGLVLASPMAKAPSTASAATVLSGATSTMATGSIALKLSIASVFMILVTIAVMTYRHFQGDRHAEANAISKASNITSERRSDVEPTLRTAHAVAANSTDSESEANLPVESKNTLRGLVEGYVIQSDGWPARGTRVRLGAERVPGRVGAEAGFDPIETETAVDGSFRFEYLPLGAYEVLALSGDSAAHTRIQTTPWERFVFVDMQLAPCSTLSGKVLDEAGSAVAGAIVVPAVSQRGNFRFDLMGATTAEDGTFILEGLVSESLRYLVQANGFAPHVTELIKPNSDSVDIVLNLGTKIVGSVHRAPSGEGAQPLKLVLYFKDDGRPWTQVFSDADGNFAYEHVGPGEYELILLDTKYALVNPPVTISITGDGLSEPLSLDAVEGSVIAGRVHDAESGNGMRNVNVRVGYKDVTTDKDGFYRIGGLESGHHFVSLQQIDTSRYSEFAMAPRKIDVEAGKVYDNVDFSLEDAVRISGIVMDPLGEPVAGACITARTETYFPTRFSGQDGRFALTLKGPDTNTFLYATKGPLAATPLGPVKVGRAGLSDVKFVLESGASVEGRVVGNTGSAISDAPVRAERSLTPGVKFIGARSGADGTYMLSGLSPGRHQIKVGPPGALTARESVLELDLKEGDALQNATLVSTVGSHGGIAGIVVDESGNPVSRVMMMVAGSDSWMQSDDSGYFSFQGLETDRTMVEVVNAEGYARGTRVFVNAGDQGVRIVLTRNVKFRGMVVESATQKPVTEFEAKFASGGWKESYGWPVDNFTSFQSEVGEFELENVQRGAGTLLVRAKGFALHEMDLEIPDSDATIEPVVVKLDAVPPLRGIVTDTVGRPIRDASVFVGSIPLQSFRAGSTAAFSSKDGSFNIESVPESIAQVSAFHADYAFATAKRAGDAAVTLIMRKGGSVQGTVHLDGAAVEGLNVEVSSSEPDGVPAQGTKTGPDGTYTFEHIVAVDIKVTVKLSTTLSASQVVSVGEGTSLPVNFNIVSGSAVLEGEILRTPELQGRVNSRMRVTATALRSDGTVEQFNTIPTIESRYRIEGMTSGHFAISYRDVLEDGDERMYEGEVELVDGQTTRYDIDTTGY